MRAFIKFNKGMMRLPIQWRLWLLLLVTANLIVPLFHLHRLEAQVVIGTLLISMMIMTGLTALTGFTRLLGLGHILWVPLLYWLWTRLGQIPPDDVFGMWIRVQPNDFAVMFKWFHTVGFSVDILGLKQKFGIPLTSFAEVIATADWAK